LYAGWIPHIALPGPWRAGTATVPSLARRRIDVDRVAWPVGIAWDRNPLQAINPAVPHGGGALCICRSSKSGLATEAARSTALWDGPDAADHPPYDPLEPATWLGDARAHFGPPCWRWRPKGGKAFR